MGEAHDLAQRHIDAFNNRTWNDATSIYSPDLVTIEPSAGTMNGIDEFVAMASGFAAALPDSRLVVGQITEDGDRVIVEGKYTGTHTAPMQTPQGVVPPSGRSLDLPYCEIFEVEAGRIARHRVYYDQMTFAAQLGLLPEPAKS